MLRSTVLYASCIRPSPLIRIMKETNLEVLIPFTALYALGILGFSIVALMFAMAAHSFESLDTDFKIVLLISLAVMPLTAILLFKTFLGESINLKKPTFLLILLSIITLIFSYYFYEAMTDEYAEKVTLFHLIPLIGLVTTIIIVIAIIKFKSNLR